MPDVHAARRAALRALIAEADLAALLVTNLLNVRYLTGFTGSNAALVVDVRGDEESVFGTDGRYTTQAAVQVPDLQRRIDRGTAPALLREARSGRWGFEADTVTVAEHARFSSACPVPLEATRGLVERLRAVKDATEIDALRQACAIADRALAELLDGGGIRPGRTEREVGLDLDERMRRLGAEDPAFETIVATGPNSAIPHHRPGPAELSTR